MSDSKPDLCDCKTYENQNLRIGEENPNGSGHLYTCDRCGYRGVVV